MKQKPKKSFKEEISQYTPYCKGIDFYSLYTQIDGKIRNCFNSLSEKEIDEKMAEYKREDPRDYENPNNKIWKEKHLLFLNFDDIRNKRIQGMRNIYTLFINKYLKEMV